MITVHWNEPTDITIRKVRIKRAVAKNAQYFLIDEVSAFNINQTWLVFYDDVDGFNGNWYKIAFVNEAGNESPESDPVMGQTNGHTSFVTQIGNKTIEDFEASDDNIHPQYPFKGYHRFTPQQYLLTGEASPYSKTPTEQGLVFFKRSVQRQEMLLRTAGEWVTLYRRKWEGDMCICYDGRRGQFKKRCEFCFGTGFVGGYDKYFNPYSDARYSWEAGNQVRYRDEFSFSTRQIGITVQWNPPKAADTVSISIKRAIDPDGAYTTIDTIDAADGYGDWVTQYIDSSGSSLHWYKISFISAIGQESVDSEKTRYPLDNEEGQNTPQDQILIRVEPTADDLKLQQTGHFQDFKASAWTMPVPALRDRDVIIRYDESGVENWRYEVFDVTRNIALFQGSSNTNYGAQRFTLQRKEKTDPIYRISETQATFEEKHGDSFKEAYGDGYGPFDSYGQSITTSRVEYETQYDIGYNQGWTDQVNNDGFNPERNSPMQNHVQAYTGYKAGYASGFHDAFLRFG